MTDTINTIGIIGIAPNIEVALISEDFKNDSIVLTLEWTVENGAFIGLNVVPQAEIMNLGSSNRTGQLVISYNTSYNISGVASLCGRYSSHSIELHYGEFLQS